MNFIVEERLAEVSNTIGEVYSKAKSQKEKREIGQFFTPQHIAEYMGRLSTFSKNSKIRILDPGCGNLILSVALIEELVSRSKPLIIELDLYETDLKLSENIDSITSSIRIFLKSLEIDFVCNVYFKDFVLENAKYLEENLLTKYNIIISNPPYFKLPKNDSKSIATQQINGGFPNIYSMFMGICSNMLSANGEMIFIVPRSFTSGLYFKKFRKYFLSNVNIKSIHLFESRNDTFKKDQVLQELLILKAVNKPVDKVYISSSSTNFEELTVKAYDYKEICDIENDNSYIFIPTNAKEEKILGIVSSWKNQLEDFDITISTGPVVDFRTKENIYKSPNDIEDLKPYFRLNHVNQMELGWPLTLFNKEQYIQANSSTKSLLRPNDNYIYLRRQSAKGDSNRLICTPYFKDHYQTDFVGIDNKLNYIYSKKRSLTKEEVLGISAILNSEFMNSYFQIFNGNINVSASEIKELKFPSYEILTDIGGRLLSGYLVGLDSINNYVNKKINYE